MFSQDPFVKRVRENVKPSGTELMNKSLIKNYNTADGNVLEAIQIIRT